MIPVSSPKLLSDQTPKSHSTFILNPHTEILQQNVFEASIEWQIEIASFDFDASYSIILNNELEDMGVYSGGNVTYLFTDLSIGINNVLFTINDGFGNHDTDSFGIYVNTPPQISCETTPVLLYNSSNPLIFTITDPTFDTSANYLLDIDGSSYSQGSYNGVDLEFTFGNLELGDHLAEITFFDGYGQDVSMDLSFIINDIASVESNLDVPIMVFPIDQFLSLTYHDEIYIDPFLEVYIDEVLSDNETVEMINDYAEVNFNIGNLGIDDGLHSVRFSFCDGYDFNKDYTINCVINPVDLITKQNNQISPEDSLGWDLIQGVGNDGFYSCFVFGEFQLYQIPFINSFEIDFSVLSFETKQSYDIFIIVRTLSNYADYNFFSISQNQDPIVDITPSELSINNSIAILNWTVFDSTIGENSKYEIWVNNTLIANNTEALANGTTTFSYLFDNAILQLPIGNYDVILRIYDGYGGSYNITIPLTIYSNPPNTSKTNWAVIGGIGGGVVVVGVAIGVALSIRKKKKAKNEWGSKTIKKVKVDNRDYFYSE